MPDAICDICGQPLSAVAPHFRCAACNSTPRQRSFARLFREDRIVSHRPDAMALCVAEERSNRALIATRFAITRANLYGPPSKRTKLGVDIRDLAPFADASFDLVTAVGVLDYVDGAERAFASVARVLRPGGQFVLHILSHLLRDGDAPPQLNKTLFSSDDWLPYVPRDVPVSTYFYSTGWTAQALRDAGLMPEVIVHDDPAGPQTWFLTRRP